MTPLKQKRIAAGMTQEELAYYTDISIRTLQDYEQGQKPLEKAAAITVLKIANALYTTVEELTGQGAQLHYKSKENPKQNNKQTEVVNAIEAKGILGHEVSQKGNQLSPGIIITLCEKAKMKYDPSKRYRIFIKEMP